MKIFAIAAALTLLSGASALAQTAPPPAQATLGGPVVPGVCLLSQQAVLANAKVGVAANVRLKQIGEDVQAELRQEGAPIDAEAKALQAQRATLKPADFQQRQRTLEGRIQAIKAKADLRNREIEATREQALRQILVDMQGPIADAYKAHGCGLLVDRNSVIGGNLANDLTAQVVQGLDAKITTISFDRVSLPAQGKQ
ncbi:MAG: OmpH family outer membrane protein [Caulobacteraceae bacterium]|nr:OmpH family outer membrane protein [Caulobacteraceae bacterium]